MKDPHSGKMSRFDATTADLFDILGQRKWWRGTGSGVHIVQRRRDLHINHKLNIMAKMIREAPQLAFAWANKTVFICAPDDVQADLDRIMREPERWMMEQPMMHALLQDVMAFADIGPEDLGMIVWPSCHNVGLSAGDLWVKRAH